MAENIEPKNDRREIFGWLMYDWANSVYYTTIVGVLIAPYLTSLAQASVGDNGIVFSLGPLGAVTAKSLTSAATVIGVIIQAGVMIILSAVADYSNLKKTFMMVLCYIGVAAAALMFFIDGDNYLLGCVLLIIANVCVGSSLVFYNAFLTEITTEDMRDRVSARGYALGYAGGSLMLMLNLLLISKAADIGISTALAVRISLLAAAIWWGGFAVITFKRLRQRKAVRERPAGRSLASLAVSEIGGTLRQLVRLKYTLMFLVAYLFYNDGIQTVIYQAAVFIEQELFIARGEAANPSFLLLLFLETQVVALIGALFWERLSRLIGAKFTILLSLVWWSAIVFYAYGFLKEPNQAWILGAAIGFVLGGTQSLSRSLYSQMIPKGKESSFFSFYEISEKGTSWMGLLTFSVIVASTGSYRQAILAVVVFFVIGGVILAFTDTRKAIHNAGNVTPQEAEGL